MVAFIESLGSWTILMAFSKSPQLGIVLLEAKHLHDLMGTLEEIKTNPFPSEVSALPCITKRRCIFVTLSICIDPQTRSYF